MYEFYPEYFNPVLLPIEEIGSIAIANQVVDPKGVN